MKLTKKNESVIKGMLHTVYEMKARGKDAGIEDAYVVSVNNKARPFYVAVRYSVNGGYDSEWLGPYASHITAHEQADAINDYVQESNKRKLNEALECCIKIEVYYGPGNEFGARAYFPGGNECVCSLDDLPQVVKDYIPIIRNYAK